MSYIIYSVGQKSKQICQMIKIVLNRIKAYQYESTLIRQIKV